MPCGVEVTQPAADINARLCRGRRDRGALEQSQARIALLPPGLVEPATKVLSIAGNGPFGMFGPDLFGDPEGSRPRLPDLAARRSRRPRARSRLADIRRLRDLDADQPREPVRRSRRRVPGRGPGQGWDWVVRRRHRQLCRAGRRRPAEPRIRTSPVQPIETGNDGRHGASMLKRSDVAIADHECPIIARSRGRRT